MAQLIKGIVDTQKNNYRSIGQVTAADDLELELEIKMNGQPIEFINPQAELLIKKSDNNRIRQTKDILYQDGKFKIKVDEQGVTYPGIVTCQLLTREDGRVSTCLFYFMVGTSLDREVLQSISKVEVLEELDEYVATAFANLDEYEKRIISADETIRKLNDDMNEAEKIRGASELERQETFKDLKENMNATISNLESSINLSNMNEKERSEVFNSLKSNLESIKQDLINLNASVESEEEKRVQAEINRVNKALEIIEKLESTNNSVATAEAERVSEFNKIKTENNTLKEALTTINNTANSNEEVRKENETSRVEAEKARVNEFNTMKLENETFKQEINEQYETIASEFDKAVANVTNGNENVTNSEIVQARGKEVNLNARLTKFDSELEQKVSESDLEVERKRIDNFTRLAEGSTTGDAELIDARVGADSILYNNVGDAIRNQLYEKLEKYIKTLVNYTEILSNGIGSDKSLVSGLKRQKYSIDIGTEYLLVGNIVTDKSVDIMAQSTSESNSGIIDETRVAKTSDGLQKIKFTAQYPYLFVTCSNENDFKLYKIDKRITTKEEVIEAVSNSKTINDLKNRNNLTVELLNNDINFTTEKEIESTATNTSTISKNGTYISEGSLKIFPTTPGKYYVIQGTSKYEKDDYGLFAFFKTNSFSDILMDTLVVVSKGEHSLNYIVQAPLNGNLLRISRGTFEIDDVKVYEYEKNEKTTNVQEMQKYKCFDDSAIKCSPYMWESIGWKTYNPRLNILMFNDFNDEHELLRETCEWFKYDEIFANRTISCIISQGDIVSLDHSSSTTWTTRAKNIVDIVNDIDKPFIFCNGNHDVGQDNTTSNFDVSTNRDIRYDNFFKPLLDRLNVTSGNRVVVDVNNPRSQYYYVDLEDNFGHKIRCFALDESEYPLIIDTDGQLKYSMCLIRTTDRERGNNTYYSEKQMNFLVSALQSCENDRLFILLNHIDMSTTDLRGSLSGSRECLHSIINGFINNTDVVATVNALENIPSYTINATFSNKSGEHPIIHFVGHYHKFEHTIIADAGNMNRVQTICGGTEGTGVMGKNSILRFGADIFSMDKDFSAYFLRFGYKYKAMAKDDGNHFIEQPLKLI